VSNLAKPVCHSLFPLLVYENKVSCHNQFKQKFLSNFESEKFPTLLSEGQSESTFLTGEFFNKTKIHKNKEYDFFFSELYLHCKSYVELLGLDSEKLNFFIMKSWLVLHESPHQTMNDHVHPESNISFAYYLSCPEGAQNFYVVNSSKQNELSPDCFFIGNNSRSSHFQILKSCNSFNENSHSIKSEEGKIIMFPGWKTPHGTKSERFDSGQCLRIAISGDIKITLKPEYSGAVSFSAPTEEWFALRFSE